MPDGSTTPPEEWKDWLEADFEPDGAFRDITVGGTTVFDWDMMLRELPKRFPSNLCQMVGGEAVDLPYPASATEILRTPDRNFFLQVGLGRVVLQSHFFSVDEIDLDMDPRQIDGWADVQSTLDFMVWLGELLQKPVEIAPEGMHERPIARYSPATGRLVRIPFDG